MRKRFSWSSLMLLLVIGLSLSACQCKSLDREAMRDEILARITGASMPQAQLNIMDFGAICDGAANCQPAFVQAIAKAKEMGGARLVVPAGIYHLCGPLHLPSNFCLDLQEGAVLRFDSDPKHYLPIVNPSEDQLGRHFCQQLQSFHLRLRTTRHQHRRKRHHRW